MRSVEEFDPSRRLGPSRSGWERHSVRVAVSAWRANKLASVVYAGDLARLRVPALQTQLLEHSPSQRQLCINSALKLVPVGQVVQLMRCAIAGVSFGLSSGPRLYFSAKSNPQWSATTKRFLRNPEKRACEDPDGQVSCLLREQYWIIRWGMCAGLYNSIFLARRKCGSDPRKASQATQAHSLVFLQSPWEGID